MKYFLDTEFIEGFHKPMFGKRRHFIDLISIGIVSEDNRALYFISSEWNYKDADKWVQENVIVPAYTNAVSGDARNMVDASNFHKRGFGETLEEIRRQVFKFMMPAGDFSPIEVYGYYADYDWVLFASLFGRMIDLPQTFPMYCNDIKQMMHEKGVDSNHPGCPKQKDTHISLHDAAWNKVAYEWLQTI